jgi:hypothetical protein
MTKKWPTTLANRDAKAATSVTNKAIKIIKKGASYVRKNPKKTVAGLALAAGPIKALTAAGAYGLYKNRKRIRKMLR